MSKQFDVSKEFGEKETVTVLSKELKELINQKNVAEFENRIYYDLVYNFIHKNGLADQFYKHIKEEQAALEGYFEPLDFDFIAMDFDDFSQKEYVSEKVD